RSRDDGLDEDCSREARDAACALLGAPSTRTAISPALAALRRAVRGPPTPARLEEGQRFPIVVPMRRFELVEGTSSNSGRPTSGARRSSCASAASGAKGRRRRRRSRAPRPRTPRSQKLVAEKIRKGYAEVGAAPAKTARQPRGRMPAEPRR